MPEKCDTKNAHHKNKKNSVDKRQYFSCYHVFFLRFPSIYISFSKHYSPTSLCVFPLGIMNSHLWIWSALMCPHRLFLFTVSNDLKNPFRLITCSMSPQKINFTENVRSALWTLFRLFFVRGVGTAPLHLKVQVTPWSSLYQSLPGK